MEVSFLFKVEKKKRKKENITIVSYLVELKFDNLIVNFVGALIAKGLV